MNLNTNEITNFKSSDFVSFENCVVKIVLIEAKNLISMDKNNLSDPYIIVRLQSEKFRSKVNHIFI